MFFTQSADGPLRRGTVMQTCQTALLAESFASVRPFIRTLQQITNVPPVERRSARSTTPRTRLTPTRRRTEPAP